MKTDPALSFVTQQAIETIGQNIQIARLRRGDTVELAAQRAGVTRQTWMRMERGNHAVSFGLVIEALQLYGFVDQIFQLADPGSDTEGLVKEAARRAKRGTTKKKEAL
jgi:transcriptional regulator with XRE-family HTH domain